MSRSRLVVRNWLIQSGSQATTFALSFLATIIIPRALGDERYGILFFALSFSTMFQTIVDAGMDTHLVKEIARDPRQAARLLPSALGTKTSLLAVIYLAMMLAAWLIGRDPVTLEVLAIVGLGNLFYPVLKVFVAVYNGRQTMGIPTIGLIAEKASYVGCATLGLTLGWYRGWELQALAWLFVGSVLLNTAIQFTFLRGTVPMRIDLAPARGWALVKDAFPYFLWLVFGQFYLQVGVTILACLRGNEEVGWFGVGIRLISALLFFPHVARIVLLPALSSASNDHDAHGRAARRAVNFMVLAGLPAAAGLSAIAPEVVPLLFGPQYGPAIPVVQVLAGILPLVYVGMVLGTLLISADRQRQWCRAAIFASVLNPALNLLLIPLAASTCGFGALGAAGAQLGTEIFMLVYFLRLVPAGILQRSNLRTLVRTLAATAVLLLATTLARPAGLPAMIVAGSLAYTVSALLFRAVAWDDIQLLVQSIRRRKAPAETQPTPRPAATPASAVPAGQRVG